MDAALAPPTRGYVEGYTLKRFAEAAPFVAVVLAVLIIVILAAATIVTTKSVEQTLGHYKALTKASSAIAIALQDQLDEESSVRGFAGTRDRALLRPYTKAQPRLHSILKSLRDQLVAGGADSDRAFREVDELRAINKRWELTIAAPLLHSPANDTPALKLRAKQTVDAYRAVSERLNGELARKLASLSLQLTSRFQWIGTLSATLIALAAVIVVAFASARASAQMRLMAENQRREIGEGAAARLRSLIETIPNIVWIADGAGRTLYANARWYEYTGLPRNGDLGVQWQAAIQPSESAAVERRWSEAVASGAEYEMDYRIRNAHGEYRWFKARAVPEKSATGEVLQWLGTCSDIDDARVRFENAQRAADSFARAQLPQALPTSPHVRFDATYLPAEEITQIGGDWYDVLAIDEHHFIFSLGDVTGHGLDAAIVMTRIRQTIIALASAESNPSRILERANAVLRQQNDCMVTALCGTLDCRTGKIVYASAGHPPSLVWHDDGPMEEISSYAPPLGVTDALSIELRTVTLAPSDIFICYTDGVIENDRDLAGGEKRLHEAIAEVARRKDGSPSAAAIREHILGTRRGRDDVAILLIERSGEPKAPARRSPMLIRDSSA